MTGPNGLILTLDRSQVVPDDPGSATPALVELKGRVATYWCACEEGEVEDVPLSSEQLEWLASVEDEIMQFLYQ